MKMWILIFLLSLSLRDIRNICRRNRYMDQLCQHPIIKKKMNIVNDKVLKIINFLHQIPQFILQPAKIISSKQYTDIAQHINIEMDEQIQAEAIYMVSINHSRSSYNLYHCMLFYDMNEPASEGSIYIGMTLKQLKEFLKHLIYDNILFTF